MPTVGLCLSGFGAFTQHSTWVCSRSTVWEVMVVHLRAAGPSCSIASRSGKSPTLLGSVGLAVVASIWLCTRVMTCLRLSGSLLLNLPMLPWCCRLGNSSRLFDSTLCLFWCGGVVRRSLALLGHSLALLGLLGCSCPLLHITRALGPIMLYYASLIPSGSCCLGVGLTRCLCT